MTLSLSLNPSLGQSIRFGAQMSGPDLDKFHCILADQPEFITAEKRHAFLNQLLEGAAERTRRSVRTRINYDGSPQTAAFNMLDTLKRCDRDDQGRDLLGLVLDVLLRRRRAATDELAGEDTATLRELQSKYGLNIQA